MKSIKIALLLTLGLQSFASLAANGYIGIGCEKKARRPVSAYCATIQSSICQEWRMMEGFDHPVLIDVDVDKYGKVTALGTNKRDRSMADTQSTAIALASLVDRLPTPPHGSLKLVVGLCNDRRKIVVAPRDLNLGKYFEKAYYRLRQAWNWPTNNPFLHCVVMLRLLNSGTVQEVRLLQPSGQTEFDRAALTIVSKSVPFQALPDGAPSYIDLKMTFEKGSDGKLGCCFKSMSEALDFDWRSKGLKDQ